MITEDNHINFDDYMNSEYGLPGTESRRKAEAELEKQITIQENKLINEKLLALPKEERLNHHHVITKQAKIVFHSCAIEGNELTYSEVLEICKKAYYKELFKM